LLDRAAALLETYQGIGGPTYGIDVRGVVDWTRERTAAAAES
jgi:hypothetical protein